MDWEQPWVVSKRESVRRSRGGGGGAAEETKSSHFLSPYLGSCVSFRVPLAIEFSRYPLNGGLASRLIRFSLLWEMDASSSQSLGADISFGSRYRARADKIAQTLVCSQIRQFHITFARFISNYREKIAPFRDEKTFFQTEKYPCVVLKCWKCFVIISYNVEHRHTVLSASWPTVTRS